MGAALSLAGAATTVTVTCVFFPASWSWSSESATWELIEGAACSARCSSRRRRRATLRCVSGHLYSASVRLHSGARDSKRAVICRLLRLSSARIRAHVAKRRRTCPKLVRLFSPSKMQFAWIWSSDAAVWGEHMPRNSTVRNVGAVGTYRLCTWPRERRIQYCTRTRSASPDLLIRG